MDYQHLSATWDDYELIDAGQNMKLERFGAVILARPETQALWPKAHPEMWERAHATFLFEKGKGVWDGTGAPHTWEVTWRDMTLHLERTNFKHIGVFPEQAANWEWIDDMVRAKGTPRVLNLFGYTGAASIVAAQAGGQVTHVDASKPTLTWANENREASGLADDAIRWIVDDALLFTKREGKRGNRYDFIIMDPPAFGRGAKNEVWHIERDLPVLLRYCVDILAEGGVLLVNGYAAGYTPESLHHVVRAYFSKHRVICGELRVGNTDTVISSGIYVRAQ